MLPGNLRLTKDKDFAKIFQDGASVYAGIFIFRVLANDLGHNRLAIVASRKVSKLAVVRNLIRRRLKAVFLQEQAKLKVGFDIIIVALPGSAKSDFAQTKAAALQGFYKSNLYERLSSG